MSLRSYEIIAWVLDGELICADCASTDNDVRHAASPVFAGEEFDFIPSCSWCGELVDEVNVIGE